MLIPIAILILDRKALARVDYPLLLTFVFFWIFGIPYPQLLALIIGITDIIPVFGPFIGAIPGVLIIFIVVTWFSQPIFNV